MFIFLDIESNDNEDTKMLEIAYMTDKHLIMNQCFNPENTTNDDGNAAIKTSKFAHQLNELLQDSGNVLVAHNAQSKVSILEQEEYILDDTPPTKGLLTRDFAKVSAIVKSIAKGCDNFWEPEK